MARERLAISSSSLAIRSGCRAASAFRTSPLPMWRRNASYSNMRIRPPSTPRAAAPSARIAASKAASKAVAVLPVEGLGLGERARPFEALKLRHDGEDSVVGRDEQQRRSLHQVEVESGEIVEARPWYEGGGIQPRVLDQRGRTVTAPVMAGHSAPSPWPKRSSCISPPKRGSSERPMIAASATIMSSIATIAGGGVFGEDGLGQRLQPAGRCVALLCGRVRVVVEHPHAHARVDHLIEELDEEDVAGECRQVAKRPPTRS